MTMTARSSDLPHHFVRTAEIAFADFYELWLMLLMIRITITIVCLPSWPLRKCCCRNSRKPEPQPPCARYPPGTSALEQGQYGGEIGMPSLLTLNQSPQCSSQHRTSYQPMRAHLKSNRSGVVFRGFVVASGSARARPICRGSYRAYVFFVVDVVCLLHSFTVA